MKKVLRDGMKTIFAKTLIEFVNDPGAKDMEAAEDYAGYAVRQYERYLHAYNEFKED